MAPENTLASVQLALKQGADYIENDIMRTSDGALVIMHDLTLARTTNVEQVFPDRSPWNTKDFTLAEIKQLDAGSWFSASYAGQRVRRCASGWRPWVPRRHAARGQGPLGVPGHRAGHRQGAALDPGFGKALPPIGSSCRPVTSRGCGATTTWRPTCRSDCSTTRRPTDQQPSRPALAGLVHPALGNIDQGIVDRRTRSGWTSTCGPSTSAAT